MQSICFVITVLFGLPPNKMMKPMNAAHKPNKSLYAVNKNKLISGTITNNKKLRMSCIAILNVIWIALIKRLAIIHIKYLTIYLLPLALVSIARMMSHLKEIKNHILVQTIKDYLKALLETVTENNLKLNKPMGLQPCYAMIFNKEDKLYHEANNTCHICGKTSINKLRDHCHETGKYRSPACNICNLNYRQQIFIPVIFHNGKSYDFNLIFYEIFLNRTIIREECMYYLVLMVKLECLE